MPQNTRSQSPRPKGLAMMAQSLDGFVARTDHNLDWLMAQPEPDEDLGFADFMARIDGLVMGRGSFETVAAFPDWPYSKPVIVASQSLRMSDIPTHLQQKIELSDKAPAQIMDELAQRGWSHVYLDGGAFLQNCIREGLVDELNITIVPILIGSGIRMFGPLDQDISLHLQESRSFSNGMVSNRYLLNQKEKGPE